MAAFDIMDLLGGKKDGDKTYLLALGLFALYYFGKKQKEKKAAAELAAQAELLEAAYPTYDGTYSAGYDMQFTPMPPPGSVAPGAVPPQGSGAPYGTQNWQQMPPQMSGGAPMGAQNVGGQPPQPPQGFPRMGQGMQQGMGSTGGINPSSGGYQAPPQSGGNSTRRPQNFR